MHSPEENIKTWKEYSNCRVHFVIEVGKLLIRTDGMRRPNVHFVSLWFTHSFIHPLLPHQTFTHWCPCGSLFRRQERWEYIQCRFCCESSETVAFETHVKERKKMRDEKDKKSDIMTTRSFCRMWKAVIVLQHLIVAMIRVFLSLVI
jgi:hypothetical protein